MPQEEVILIEEVTGIQNSSKVAIVHKKTSNKDEKKIKLPVCT